MMMMMMVEKELIRIQETRFPALCKQQAFLFLFPQWPTLSGSLCQANFVIPPSPAAAGNNE